MGTLSKCLVQEHNTLSLARARNWTASYGEERSSHEATMPQEFCY